MLFWIFFISSIFASETCQVVKVEDQYNYQCEEHELKLNTTENFLRLNPYKDKSLQLEECLNAMIPISYGYNVIFNKNLLVIYGQFQSRLGAYFKISNQYYFLDFTKFIAPEDQESIYKINVNSLTFYLKVSKHSFHLADEFKAKNDFLKNNKKEIKIVSLQKINHHELDHEYYTALDSAIDLRLNTVQDFQRDFNTHLKNEALGESYGIKSQSALLLCKNLYLNSITFKKDLKLSLYNKISHLVTTKIETPKESHPQVKDKKTSKSN